MKELAIAVSLLLVTACDNMKGTSKVELKSDDQKFSYMVGQNIGKGLKAQGLTIDAAVLSASISDALSGKPSRMTEEEMRQSMQKMHDNLIAKQDSSGKENIVKGQTFLEENKKKKGVVTTKSGLQYEVIAEGKGPMPKKEDVVSVHYKGTLLDGTEFDSSHKRNQPAEFPVGGVIPGWTEALQLMKTGSKWKLYIPSALAYGERGSPPTIPANSVLQFEVELLSIKGGKGK